ncbi:GNAT family N-acetyltransferase [bacterium]|nr:GNAT family N-acetyltransferase [bacterium]MBU1024763.1 GNAT family N-acetyltransferase [bacterium]
MLFNRAFFKQLKETVQIRRAEIQDAGDIARIQREAFSETIHHYLGSRERNRGNVVSLTDRLYLLITKAMKDEIFIAEVDGKVVGNIIVPYDIELTSRTMPGYGVFWLAMAQALVTMTVVSNENRKALFADRNYLSRFERFNIRKEIPSRIFNLAVDPEYQGRRIGNALMEKGMNYLFTERGTSAVTLNVMAQNVRAVTLYRTCGFQEIKRVENSMGEWIVMVLTRENWLKLRRSQLPKKYSTA